MSEMCGKHSAEWQSWLSYRLTPTPAFVQIGTMTPTRMRENREARFREWGDTIRSQQDSIKKTCAAGTHCGEADQAFAASA